MKCYRSHRRWEKESENKKHQLKKGHGFKTFVWKACGKLDENDYSS